MLMSVVLVHSADGQFPIQVLERGSTTLLECRDAGAFLRHIGALDEGVELPSDAYVRAVVTRTEGAWVELYDALGSVCAKPWRLEPDKAKRLLVDAW